ncbi:MAG: glycosyltransferase 87 family protein [Vulcanimicrobiaceae bacterium]
MVALSARAALLAVAFAFVAIALFGLRPHATAGPALRDFESYYAAGATWAVGGNPYGREIWNAESRVPGVVERREEVLPFIGPPQTLPVWALFSRLPFAQAARVWTACLIASLLVLIWFSLRGSGAAPAGPAGLAAIALAVGFGPITSNIALGQAALLALAGATLAAGYGNAVLPAAAGGMLAAFQPNVALALLTQITRRRIAYGLAIAAFLSYCLGAFARGPGWPVAYLRALGAHHAAEGLTAIQHTPSAILYGFGVPPALAFALGIGIAVLTVAVAVTLCLTIREPFARFATCCALVPFAATFFHEHDFAVAYVPAIWCAVRSRGSMRAVALTGTLFAAIDWFGLAQRPDGLAQSAALAWAAALAFAAMRADVDLDVKISVALTAVAIAFGAGALLALSHPAPVWPDTLTSFHPPPALSVAQVWALEQQRTGLAARVPAWSLLRLAPLLGSALLAYASARTAVQTRTDPAG